MNFSSAFGIILAAGIVVFAIVETGLAKLFLDMHAILIVIGGTLAVSCLIFPIGHLLSLSKVFLLRILGKHKADFQGTIEQILELNKKMSIGASSLNDTLPTIKHEFLREAVSLVAAGVLTEKEIRHALEKRIDTIEAQYMREAKMFQTIGRFPPAFGLMAATLAMIAILSKVGQPGSEKTIGPAMAIGMVGTFYGIALANFVFLPLGEQLVERTEEEIALRKMIVEGAILLKSQVNPVTMRETLNSFLLPRDRVTKKAAA